MFKSKCFNIFRQNISSRSITKHARIFSYAVGPHPLPTVALKKMACDTGGAFTTITSMGAIRTKIQVQICNFTFKDMKSYKYTNYDSLKLHKYHEKLDLL